jgi:nucleoside-diphosphate-sugar epimerase
MRILVTGAAGLIGGELVARLAGRGHAVTALVHKRHAVAGNDGVVLASRPADGAPPGPGEVATLAGDVRLPGFGLDAVPDVELVLHSAAITAFDAAPEVYEAVNLGGARHAVALAEAAGAALLQVSTAYVCGTRDGRIGEDETGTAFVNGYEASKEAGEALVRAALARGLRAAIARPSIVVGDSGTGQIRSFDNIYMIFRLIAEGRVRTLPGAAGASLDLVPIDHVCTGIVAMAEDMARVAGRTLHLVADAPTPLASIGAAIAAVPGLGTPNFVDPADFAPENLPSVERRYHAAAASLYTNYLLRGPVFDTAVARQFVPPCPDTGRAWLDLLIGYCVEAGFVKARPSARQGIDSAAFSA